MKSYLTQTLSILIAGALLVGCGAGQNDGQQSGGIEALQLPLAIGITLPPESSEVPSKAVYAQKLANAGYGAEGTDYSNAESAEYLMVDSEINLELANLFLCMVDKAQIQSHLNKGPYSVSNINNCADSPEAQVPKNVVVDAHRESNESPQYIDISMDFDATEYSDANIVYLQFIVYEGVSKKDSLGEFELQYLVEGNIGGDVRAYLRVVNSKIDFAYSQESDNGPSSFSSALYFSDKSLSDGLAKTVWHFNESENVTLSVLNEEKVAGWSEHETATCESRTETISSVWRYGLYDLQTGDEITESVYGIPYIHEKKYSLNDDGLLIGGQEYRLDYFRFEASNSWLDGLPNGAYLASGTPMGDYVLKQLITVIDAKKLDESACAGMDLTSAENLAIFPPGYANGKVTLVMEDRPVIVEE